MAKIKIKAKSKKGVIKIRALLSHKMETGLRKNKKTGKLVPANYITDLVVKHNDKDVVVGDIGISISKNPYFAFYVTGNKGDKVAISYKDNKGKHGSKEVKSK
jgi:sulfur-oxidizing protein SoxZ